MDAVSGLAGKIRACKESDQFDLSGYDKAQCTNLVKAAFSDPVPLAEMVRISFVVGGGKQCRQKYSDDLPKDVTQGLDAIGYDEDRAAACELGSAGRYKFQHDTSKNLKFVHVFPRVVPPEKEDGGEDGDGGRRAARSPETHLAECSLDEFRRLVDQRLIGYGPKMAVLDKLKGRLAKFESAEQKLITREPLTDEEQAAYNDSVDLSDKTKHLAAELQSAVDNCQLTASERTQVMAKLDSKVTAITAEIKKAESEGKPKAQAKLQEQLDKLRNTRKELADATPIPRTPLRHASELRKLHRQLLELKRLEKDSAGHYTLDELKRLGEKPELEEAIGVLEKQSRIWFETDEDFQLRVQDCIKSAASSAPAKKAPPKDTSGGFTVVGKKGGRK